MGSADACGTVLPIKTGQAAETAFQIREVHVCCLHHAFFKSGFAQADAPHTGTGQHPGSSQFLAHLH
jgi:hypothetical protein